MMPKQRPFLAAAALAAFVPLSPLGSAAEEAPPAFRLAMMDMMPMGGGGSMQQPAPAPGGGMGGMMDDDKMRMGRGGSMQQQPAPAPGGAAMPGMPAAPGAQSAQAPGGGMGGMMDDDKMRMGGGGGMQAQGPGPMPMPMGQAQQQPMAMCPMMMNMMQNMMRMGAGQQQGMAPMQGGAGPGGSMGMGAMGGGAMAGGVQPMGSSAARLEGRIAFLRAELRITDAQAPAWERFAAALRSGREHLDAARAALQDSNTGADPMARLEAYETHLRARSEAIHTTRMAFNTLYGQLDEAQKRAATVTMLPFIGTF